MMTNGGILISSEIGLKVFGAKTLGLTVVNSFYSQVPRMNRGSHRGSG